jgi:hypothetical protein
MEMHAVVRCRCAAWGGRERRPRGGRGVGGGVRQDGAGDMGSASPGSGRS